MKMTVFGASGGTGTQAVTQALDAGHDVLVVVRDRSRLLVVSGSGPFTAGDGPLLRYVGKPITQRVLRYTFADFTAIEAVVRASGMDWTTVRPPALTSKPLTGRYRTRRERNVRRSLRVSRADLAHLILAISGDPGTDHAAIFIAR
jgi:uncharacterized protein YbjT (DUF2867 family)